MSLETSIRASLVAALGGAVHGVSVGRLSESYALPWVTLNRIDTPRRHAFGTGNPVTRSKPRFQFDVWAESFIAADGVMVLLVPAVCALPYAVELVSQNGREDAASGYWHAQLDAKVAHAGA